jgi:hypothetical protein
MKKNQLYPFLLIVSVVITISACCKDMAGAETSLSYKMLADKTWYLDYAQTITGTMVKTKTYIGQFTYFINFLKNLTTVDSDGIAGTYTIEKIDGQLQIHVKAKTINGGSIEYVYTIESMGDKNMVLTYAVAAVTTKLYYSNKN